MVPWFLKTRTAPSIGLSKKVLSAIHDEAFFYLEGAVSQEMLAGWKGSIVLRRAPHLEELCRRIVLDAKSVVVLLVNEGELGRCSGFLEDDLGISGIDPSVQCGHPWVVFVVLDERRGSNRVAFDQQAAPALVGDQVARVAVVDAVGSTEFDYVAMRRFDDLEELLDDAIFAEL